MARELGRDDRCRARAQPAVHVRRAAEAACSRRSSTATAAAWSSAATSTARSACTPPRGTRIRTDLSATLFLTPPEDVRRRRAPGRGHLRRAHVEAAGRRHGAVSGDQPAPRHAGDARRAHLVVLLDPEHGRGRRPPHAAVRSRHGDRAAHPRHARPRRRSCRSPAAITTCCGCGPNLERDRRRLPHRRRVHRRFLPAPGAGVARLHRRDQRLRGTAARAAGSPSASSVAARASRASSSRRRIRPASSTRATSTRRTSSTRSALRRAAGVSNVALPRRGASREMLDAELPAFDFIVLHGVYSWVPERCAARSASSSVAG